MDADGELSIDRRGTVTTGPFSRVRIGDLMQTAAKQGWLEMPSGKEAAAAVLAAAGATVDTRTMLAMTGAEAKAALEAGQALGTAYRAPGTS